jgi:poly(A) polymerase
MMKEIWALQPRFLQRSGQRPFRLLEHPRFRAGFDFLLLRCESGELPKELGEWWDTFQGAGPHERQAMLKPGEGPRRRRRRRRKSAAAAGTAEGQSVHHGTPVKADASP